MNEIFGIPINQQTILAAAGLVLITLWSGKALDPKAIIAKLNEWFGDKTKVQPMPTVKKVEAAPNNTDVRVSSDRLDHVLSKLDEVSATQMWITQNKETIRKEIKAVRDWADLMESKLDAIEATPGVERVKA